MRDIYGGQVASSALAMNVELSKTPECVKVTLFLEDAFLQVWESMNVGLTSQHMAHAQQLCTEREKKALQTG